MVQDKYHKQLYNLKNQDKWNQVINNILSIFKILKYKCGTDVPIYFLFGLNILNDQVFSTKQRDKSHAIKSGSKLPHSKELRHKCRTILLFK